MPQRQSRSSGRGPDVSARAVAQSLGWFSIGLGLAELLAPRTLARALGMDGSERLIQAYGIREIGAGIGIFLSENPAPWVWGRVAGDALDIATLAVGMTGDNPKKANVGIALAAVAGATAVDVWCAQALSAEAAEQSQQPVRDYSDRSGFPRPAHAMRGAAGDFQTPRDMRAPEAMRPYLVS